jgi:hypothetical protein
MRRRLLIKLGCGDLPRLLEKRAEKIDGMERLDNSCYSTKKDGSS